MKNNKSIMAILLLLAASGIIFLVIGTIFENHDSSQSERKKAEEELACFLEEKPGVGEASVRLCIDEKGKIVGAAVICHGGNDPKTKSEIIGLLSTALGLGTNKIYVTGTES